MHSPSTAPHSTPCHTPILLSSELVMGIDSDQTHYVLRSDRIAHYTSLYCIMSPIVSLSCHVILCYVILCRVMSCHVMSCHAISSTIMSCHTILRYTVLYCTVRTCAIFNIRFSCCTPRYLIISTISMTNHIGFSYHAISYPLATIRHNHYPP